jgi:hypothetical protein
MTISDGLPTPEASNLALESGSFVWLVTPGIVDEYKKVAKRLRI